jgi:AGZA family xanthine/uracil permease-like MFS transporter
MTERYRWAAPGDVNAFFGLVLDNIAGLILIVSLLSGFGMPPEFSLRYLIPGTALGVLFGDLCYFYMAFRLAKKSNNPEVTAMPLGLDTPSIFGIMLFVVGPAFLKANDRLGDIDAASIHAWQIGIGCLFLSGLFKVFCAWGANWARETFPRAGLLGSLTAIALVLISFLPLLDIMSSPIVGMLALSIVLISLVGQVAVPLKIPGTVAALLVAGLIHFLMVQYHLLPGPDHSFDPRPGIFPTEWMSAFSLSWISVLGEAAGYLPIVIPFALGTVVGGIDCTESASAAGDHYSTRQVIGVEAFATLFAALCGGICQTTPYIGHPAYKAMGGRAAYVLATALVIGLGGVLGFVGFFYLWIPKAAVYPILIFIGLEITSQSFLATPKRHYAAVALACVPALAFLSVHFVGQIFSDASLREAKIGLDTLANGHLREGITTAKLLANGFLLTGLIWSSGLAMAIDRRMTRAAMFFAAAGLMTMFGVIHSPLDSNAVFLPFEFSGLNKDWVLDASLKGSMWSFAIAYFATATLLGVWGLYLNKTHQAGPMREELTPRDAT